jgi:hypothetical protein
MDGSFYCEKDGCQWARRQQSFDLRDLKNIQNDRIRFKTARSEPNHYQSSVAL